VISVHASSWGPGFTWPLKYKPFHSVWTNSITSLGYLLMWRLGPSFYYEKILYYEQQPSQTAVQKLY
jgi:hypothetical protein